MVKKKVEKFVKEIDLLSYDVTWKRKENYDHENIQTNILTHNNYCRNVLGTIKWWIFLLANENIKIKMERTF